MRLSPRLRLAIAACALVAAFLGNNAARLAGAAPEDLFLTWRSYDDFAIAAGYASRDTLPVAPYRVRDVIRREKDPRFRDFKAQMLARIAANDIRPAAFWRTYPADEVSHDGRWLIAKRFDDSGRALLLGMGFRVLGGAAPYLLFWLAVLLAVPVLGWTLFELAAAGRMLVGIVFIALLSLSAFVLDVLSLGYSAVGFHLVALLGVVPLATYAAFATPTVRGLAFRVAGGAALIALCGVCRGTTPFLLPGFAAALALGCARLPSAPRRSRILTAAAAMAFLVVPYVGLRAWTLGQVTDAREAYGRDPMPQYHDAALLVWKGLGDFDRTKGYAFRDKAGEEAIMRVDPEKQARRDSEVLLRRLILDDVREDPLWLLTILAKRLLATVSLYKIWPWTPRDGIAAYPATSVNEGVIDGYYSLTRHADWFTVARSTFEVPMAALLLPSIALVVLALASGRVPRLRPVAGDARRALLVLGCVALAVLPTPVGITTATALETQCFVIVHFLAFGFLADVLWAIALRRSSEPASA